MDNMKRCPMCGQMVRAEALKCRFCGYWFNTADSTTPPPNNHAEREGQQRQQNEAGQRQEGTRRQQEETHWQQEEVRLSYPGERLITVMGTIQEGVGIGLKNFLSIFLACILYILTIWVPYINVGTTIALNTLPLKLCKNPSATISPTFIFDGYYRKYMGEFFSLVGLMGISVLPALLFTVVPAIIISYGWSQALYLLLDKEMSPSDAMMESTKITYGYKSTLFWIDIVCSLVFFVIAGIVIWLIGTVANSLVVSAIIMAILTAIFFVIKLACGAVAYRELSKRVDG